MSDLNGFNEELRKRLQDYRVQNRLSNGDLGRELGCHPTAVSKYLNGKPEGDIARFESVAEDVLKAAERRKKISVELFDCKSSRMVNGSCELIRKTNDVGLIHGPAGVGKSCGIALYLRANPSAVLLTMTRWRRSAEWVERLLFDSIETRNWHKKRVSRAQFLIEKFTGSNRLIIVDNAHRLTPGGREYLFDFHDETNVPVALVGNPEILDAIAADDQQFSRIGLKKQITISDARSVAEKIMHRMAPDGGDDLLELAEQVASQRGHMRALRKDLSLASELRETENLSWVKAFRAAHDQQVRDYKLA